MFNRAKTDTEITAMRTSGKLLASVLTKLSQTVEAGMTTGDLNEIAQQELHGTGGTPAFLGYHGFPGALCVSINDEVVHGTPSTRRQIKSGDVVSMDFGVIYDGMITDSALSLIVGQSLSSRHQALVKDTEAALKAGIAVVRAGATTGDIGYAVETVLRRGRYGIVRDLVGHGVGHELHEDPNVPNFGKKGGGDTLAAGMTIAIEPMATLGDFRVFVESDQWTVKTIDGSRAAHFEHTVLVTPDSYEILTRR